MAILIQQRDRNIMQFAFEFRVVTYRQVRKKFFAGNHESASRNRLNALCKHGFLKFVSANRNGRLLKCVCTTEKAWPLIETKWEFDIDRPHFRSESIEHDFRMAEIGLRFQRLSLFDQLFTENMLQSSAYLADHHLYKDLVTIQSDGALSLKDKEGNSFLYAIELEISKKAPERYRQKLGSYYRAGGIDGVIYICGNQEIQDVVARADREVRTKEGSIVYLANESSVVESAGKIIFKGAESNGIGIY